MHSIEKHFVWKTLIIAFLCHTTESEADRYLHNYIFSNGVVIALIAILVWPSIINLQNIIYDYPDQQVCEITNVYFYIN